jgi:hypothetical protein
VPWSALSERLGDVDPARRLVVIPVGELDLRAATALDYAWRVSARERKALHVAVDEDALWRLGRAWMASGIGWPLHTVENDGGVGRTIAKAVEFELASGFEQVVVLAGRVDFRRRAARLLHDRTADRIGSAVARVPGAIGAVMNVRTL